MSARVNVSAAATTLFALAFGLGNCGLETDHPLGGPHGGSGNPADPSGAPAPGTGSADPLEGSGGRQAGGGSGRSAGVDGGMLTSGDAGIAPGALEGGPSPSDASPPPLPPAPTFTMLFDAYLAAGTVGDCARSGCHSVMSSPALAHSYLWGNGYISGTTSAIVTTQSCLSWYGGTMPPHGPSSAGSAVTDFNAWVAAGAQNN